MKTFRDRLREAREKTGKTQVETDVCAGLPEGTYAQYEQGHREPSLANFRLLCLALGVSADYVLGLHLSIENDMLLLKARVDSIELKLVDKPCAKGGG